MEGLAALLTSSNIMPGGSGNKTSNNKNSGNFDLFFSKMNLETSTEPESDIENIKQVLARNNTSSPITMEEIKINMEGFDPNDELIFQHEILPEAKSIKSTMAQEKTDNTFLKKTMIDNADTENNKKTDDLEEILASVAKQKISIFQEDVRVSLISNENMLNVENTDSKNIETVETVVVPDSGGVKSTKLHKRSKRLDSSGIRDRKGNLESINNVDSNKVEDEKQNTKVNSLEVKEVENKQEIMTDQKVVKATGKTTLTNYSNEEFKVDVRDFVGLSNEEQTQPKKLKTAEVNNGKETIKLNNNNGFVKNVAKEPIIDSEISKITEIKDSETETNKKGFKDVAENTQAKPKSSTLMNRKENNGIPKELRSNKSEDLSKHSVSVDKTKELFSFNTNDSTKEEIKSFVQKPKEIGGNINSELKIEVKDNKEKVSNQLFSKNTISDADAKYTVKMENKDIDFESEFEFEQSKIQDIVPKERELESQEKTAKYENFKLKIMEKNEIQKETQKVYENELNKNNVGKNVPNFLNNQKTPKSIEKDLPEKEIFQKKIIMQQEKVEVNTQESKTLSKEKENIFLRSDNVVVETKKTKDNSNSTKEKSSLEVKQKEEIFVKKNDENLLNRKTINNSVDNVEKVEIKQNTLGNNFRTEAKIQDTDEYFVNEKIIKNSVDNVEKVEIKQNTTGDNFKLEETTPTKDNISNKIESEPKTDYNYSKMNRYNNFSKMTKNLENSKKINSKNEVKFTTDNQNVFSVDQKTIVEKENPKLTNLSSIEKHQKPVMQSKEPSERISNFEIDIENKLAPKNTEEDSTKENIVVQNNDKVKIPGNIKNTEDTRNKLIIEPDEYVGKISEQNISKENDIKKESKRIRDYSEVRDVKSKSTEDIENENIKEVEKIQIKTKETVSTNNQIFEKEKATPKLEEKTNAKLDASKKLQVRSKSDSKKEKTLPKTEIQKTEIAVKKNSYKNESDTTSFRNVMASRNNVENVEVKEVENKVQNFYDYDNVLEQVTDNINMNFNSATKELKVRLTPEELGDVELKISIEENIMKAEFVVENEKVKEILESRFNELKNTLLQKGIETSDINVYISNGNEKHAESHDFEERFGKRTKNDKMSSENEIVSENNIIGDLSYGNSSYDGLNILV